MWFYKIDGVLDGFTFPEDRGTRSRAAQEFQSKQTLFSKKLQGKCYITVSQIKGGRITLAAVSLESYNILARCREFLREAEVPVKNLIAQEITYDVLRSLLQAAERWGFLEDDRDVYNLFHLEELQHNIYDFQEFLLPERATLGQQKKETAQLFCQDAFDPELDISDCDTIVCVGNGLKDESLDKYRELAALLGGKIAATRPVVDRELLPYKLQVGQSGVMIKPKLYIGFGISGAVNHVTGVNADKFIAVNKDPNAPIFNYCDYGIVGDMDEVCDEMIRQLKG